MRIKGFVRGMDGKEMHITLEEEMDLKELEKHIMGDGTIRAIVDIVEKDSITHLQRKHLYALIGDVAEYMGYPDEVIKSFMKYKFMMEEHLEEYPSFATNEMKMGDAGKMIDMIISYCIQNEIPFRKQQFYLTADVSKMVYALTMKRLCVACGKPHAEIHHATNLVGMGNKRAMHDHWNSTYLALCRAHHTEAHSMPLEDFCKKYYVKPVKLSVEDLEEIRVM